MWSFQVSGVTISMTSFVHDLGIFWSGTSLQWIIGESAGEGLLLFGVSDRWKVTYDMWHATNNFFKRKSAKKITKVPKNANKWQKIGEKCQKKGGGGCIGATIRTGQESKCLPYAGLFKKSLDRLTDQQTDFYSCSGQLKSNLSNYLCYFFPIHVYPDALSWKRLHSSASDKGDYVCRYVQPLVSRRLCNLIHYL